MITTRTLGALTACGALAVSLLSATPAEARETKRERVTVVVAHLRVDGRQFGGEAGAVRCTRPRCLKALRGQAQAQVVAIAAHHLGRPLRAGEFARITFTQTRKAIR